MIQRLTEGEFCSTAHRKLFDTEESEITAARLRQSRELGQLAGVDEPDESFVRFLADFEPNGKLASLVRYVPVHRDVPPTPRHMTEAPTVWSQPPWQWLRDQQGQQNASDPAHYHATLYGGTAHDAPESITIGQLTPGLPPVLNTGSRPALHWQDPDWYRDSGLAPVADDTGRFRVVSRPLFDASRTGEMRMPTAFDPHPEPLVSASRTDEFALPEPVLLDLTAPALLATVETQARPLAVSEQDAEIASSVDPVVAASGEASTFHDEPAILMSAIPAEAPTDELPVPDAALWEAFVSEAPLAAAAIPDFSDLPEPEPVATDPGEETQALRPLPLAMAAAPESAAPEPEPPGLSTELYRLNGAGVQTEIWKFFRLVGAPIAAPPSPAAISLWTATAVGAAAIDQAKPTMPPIGIELAPLPVLEPRPVMAQAFGLSPAPLEGEPVRPLIFNDGNATDLSPQTRVSKKIFRLGVGSAVDVRLLRHGTETLTWSRKPALRTLRLSVDGLHRRAKEKKGIGETLLAGATSTPKSSDRLLAPVRQMKALWNAAPADLRWAGLIVPVMVGALFGVALLNQSGEPVKNQQAHVARDEEAPQVEAPPAPGSPLPAETVASTANASTSPAPEALSVTVRKPMRQMANVLDHPVIGKKTEAAEEPMIGPEASPSGQPVEPWKQDLQIRWARLMDKIQRRAAVAYVDDFRSGLSNWAGPRNWARTWSYDNLGFIRPGTLAVYEPSMVLEDYRMEFLALPEHQSVTWAYRVMDWKNYYASRLVVMDDDGLSQIAIEHWAVIDGRVSKFERKALPAGLRPESFCRLRLEVRGDSFAVWLQGNLIDHWSDSRLTAGGVGFLSAKGASAKIRWMEVSHQYDVLGRLCASLAPAGTRIRNGG